MRDRLFLFDIDGTLITTGGAGTRSMNLAFEELFGIENAFRDISMAGKTDLQIMKEGLSKHGISFNSGNLERMRDGYLRFLRREIENPDRGLMPGIEEFLQYLKDNDVATGLLTGNLEEGARIKLDACGIFDYFIDGAFGSDHEDRDRLLPIAIEKFGSRGMNFRPEQCIIIGDMPRDVRCARVHGAVCIAVATGPYSREALEKTDADAVVKTLNNFMDCLSQIGIR